MLDPEKINFIELGFHAGLEVHHQIKSTRKLFCNCKPDLIRYDKPDYTFERYFRPVLGEMGDFDPGMLVEFEKGYQVIYYGWDNEICTYEMDETPPFFPDEGAIETGYKLAFLFNCTAIVDELVTNRKQYLDGSITTGFQRTMIIGRDGHIPLSSGKEVRITNVLIEEDAARKVKTENNGRTVYYNLDRLGIPLTEVITNYLDVDTPSELVEVAKTIGNVLRLSKLGKRGIGTARQDVNISIDGGNRVELKGVQDLSMMEKYCARECVRQHSLLEIKSTLLKRGKLDIEHSYIDVTGLLEATGWIEDRINESIYAVKLPNFGGILKKEVQPSCDFGMEMFDKAELITGIPRWNMFHSDEISCNSIRKNKKLGLPEITEENNMKLIDTLQIKDEKDAYIVVYGPRSRVLHALKKIVERAKQAYIGVPQETRCVLLDGNNEFLRVIHGKDRLYPDTDTPSMPTAESLIESAEKSMDLRPWELEDIMLPLGFTRDQVELLIRHEKTDLFLDLVKKGFPEKLVYHCLVELAIHLRRRGYDFSLLSTVEIELVIRAVAEKRVPNNKMHQMLEAMLEVDERNAVEIIDSFSCETVDKSKLDGSIKGTLREFNNWDGDVKIMRSKAVVSILKQYENLNGSLINSRIEEILLSEEVQ